MHLRTYLPLALSFILFFPQAQPKYDPVTIFDELWQTFSDRYAGFEPRRVDWDQIRTVYRSMVNSEMSKEALFDVCCQMISELNDAHTALMDESGKQLKLCNSNGFPDSTVIFYRYGGEEAFAEFVDQALIRNGFNKPVSSEKHNHYSTNGRWGYVRLNRMHKSYEGFAAALEELRNTEGLILDIRSNPGGSDKYLHQVAGRMVNVNEVGHYKETRKPKTDTYSELKPWNISPYGDWQYLKPVIILTSDFSASGSEVFTMTMKRMPHVTVIGTNTNGSLSHMSGFKLKNGWRVSLSNKRTYSRDMVNYEGKGVPPDIYIENISLEEDEVLLKALEVLESN